MHGYFQRQLTQNFYNIDLVSRDGWVALPRGAMGLSAVLWLCYVLIILTYYLLKTWKYERRKLTSFQKKNRYGKQNSNLSLYYDSELFSNVSQFAINNS